MWKIPAQNKWSIVVIIIKHIELSSIYFLPAKNQLNFTQSMQVGNIITHHFKGYFHCHSLIWSFFHRLHQTGGLQRRVRSVLNADRLIGLLCNPVRISPQAHLADWQGLFTGGEAVKKGAYRTCDCTTYLCVWTKKGTKTSGKLYFSPFFLPYRHTPAVGAGGWSENKN